VSIEYVDLVDYIAIAVEAPGGTGSGDPFRLAVRWHG
jgi:hypothetical protein